MRGNVRTGILLALVLVLNTTHLSAQQLIDDILCYLPKNGEIADWTADDTPSNYHGEDLFLMIDGGADIYHEYGFHQALSAHYVNNQGHALTVEIYEMDSPAAAYGMFSFKTGDTGRVLAIGQEALLEDYYLNFWKGNTLVTVVGSDSDQKTVQAVIDFAKAIDSRLLRIGQRPVLAEMLLNEPVAFSTPKYIRGSIGVANNTIFDTDDIFHVREGMVGLVDHCQALVFRYQNENESTEIYNNAIDKLANNSRFQNGVRNGNHYSMVDRRQSLVIINQTRQYIAIVIGQEKDKVKALSNQLSKKLRNGLTH